MADDRGINIETTIPSNPYATLTILVNNRMSITSNEYNPLISSIVTYDADEDEYSTVNIYGFLLNGVEYTPNQGYELVIDFENNKVYVDDTEVQLNDSGSPFIFNGSTITSLYIYGDM